MLRTTFSRAPDLTIEEPARPQVAYYSARTAGRGDPHVGYRISTTPKNGVAEVVALGCFDSL